ncbi:putative clathrin assembly protein At4g40080, partial [Hibiscus syriacus]|uniref:putative clathrin assembly protein At4g40080 n=1 Tax=Hibiscus syriacus TaxID=106335 RepID=UPI0019204C57
KVAVAATKRHKAYVRRVIQCSNTHGSDVPPADHRIAAIISLGHSSCATAFTCIQALIDRLHRTRNSKVALKCLYTIHNIIGKGSYVLNDQLAMYPSFGGWNFLNLWTFRDDSNPEAIEMSAWVRWYAGMLEQNLTVSRMLGYHLNSTPRSNNRNKILDSELLKEIDVLINFADHLSTVPNSLYLKRESLVYESLRLVSEDYRLVQREIFVRVVELGARTTILSSSECTEFLSAINRLGCCKERVSLLLVNRNRNEDLWDLIKGTKENLVATMKKEEEQGKMVAISVGNESRMLNGFSELYRLASRGRWVEF